MANATAPSTTSTTSTATTPESGGAAGAEAPVPGAQTPGTATSAPEASASAGAKLPEAGTPAAAAAPPPATPEVPTRAPVADAAAKLLGMRRRVQVKGEELSQAEKKLAEERQALEARQKELASTAQLQELIKTDPLEAVKMLVGGDENLTPFLQKLTDTVVQSGKATPGLSKEDREKLAQVEQLRAELGKVQKELDDRRTQLEQERKNLETQQMEVRAAQYLDAGWKELSQKAEDFELVLASDAYKARVEARVIQNGTKAAEEARSLGRKPTPLTTKDFVAAAKEVQADLEKELEPALKTKRIQSRFTSVPVAQPASAFAGAPTAAEGQSAAPVTSRTVTGERGDPPVSPEWANLSTEERLYQFMAKGVRPKVGGQAN